MERADFRQWSAKDVARLLALLEAQLGYYREIAAALPIPLAVLSKDRAVVWTNRAFRKRFGTRTEDLPARGFTEISMRAWHDEDETETLLVVQEVQEAAAPAIGAIPAGLPAIVWQADAATLEFRSVEGEPRSHVRLSCLVLARPPGVFRRAHPSRGPCGDHGVCIAA